MNKLPFETTKRRYLDALANTLSPGTVANYKSNIKSLQLFLQTHHPNVKTPEQLKRRPHIEGWLRSMATRQPAYANGTRIIRILNVRRFLMDIDAWQWTRKPVADLLTTQDMPPLGCWLPNPLSPEVDVRIQKALRAQNDLKAKGLLLARHAGLRIGELRNLKRNCLMGGRNGPWSIRVCASKTHNERVVPIDEDTQKTVNAIQDECGRMPSFIDPQSGRPVKLLLCTPDGRRLGDDGLRKRLKKTAKSIGIQERMYPHRLRHTYATEMLRFGVSLLGVMKLLGHRSPKMTLRYLDINQEDLTQAYLKGSQRARQRYEQLGECIQQNITKLGENPDILGAFDDLIAQIQQTRFEHPNPTTKKKLQRVVEAIRRTRDKLPDLLS